MVPEETPDVKPEEKPEDPMHQRDSRGKTGRKTRGTGSTKQYPEEKPEEPEESRGKLQDVKPEEKPRGTKGKSRCKT